MSSIISSSSYSAGASKGFSGLVSGINTDEMVTKLLTGTQSRIDAQKANKQVLLWKQEAYRDVIAQFNHFKDQFFSFTSSQNLMSASFYNARTATVSSDAVKVTATNRASTEPIKINEIKQLAKQHTEKSVHQVSGDLNLRVDLVALAAMDQPISLEMNLDGVSKKLTLDGQALDIQSFGQALQQEINRAFGNGVIVREGGGVLTLEAQGYRQLSLGGDGLVLEALGTRAGISNKINQNLTLRELNLQTPLQGDLFHFQINGVTIEGKSEMTVNEILQTINNSDAGVHVSYSSLEDAFVIKADQYGRLGEETYEFSMTNETGNLLTSLFGITSSGSVVGPTLKLSAGEEGEPPVVSGDTLLTELGWFGQWEVNGKTVNLDGIASIQELETALNTAIGESVPPRVVFDETEKRFEILGVEIPMDILPMDENGLESLKMVFASEGIRLNQSPQLPEGMQLTATGTQVVQAGENAVLTVNGIQIERNQNQFDLSGVQVDLQRTTGLGEAEIDIQVSRNTQQILEGIQSFVKEYNSLLDKLNGLINEEASFKRYPPLTEAQRKEMSDREIELWEEKAKEGLLRRDPLISGALQSMRSALYTKPGDAPYALFDLGIQTGSWSERGKLVMAEPPTQLIEALAKDPDGVARLFNGSGGLAVELNRIIDQTARVSSGSPGSLVRLAGANVLSGKNHRLAQEMDSIDKTLKTLANSYEKEKTRYWKQFNAMEQMINQMNQQSMWLSSQFM